jgi:hypothetical protein
VVVAVTKNEGGARFGSYMTALEKALGGEVVGAVLVRPRDELTVGKRAQARVSYDQWVSVGKLRPFALDSEKMDFEQMQCLLRIQQRAGAGELLLGGQPFGLDQARNLIIRLKLLENLKLLRFVFEGWPVAESVRARPGPGDGQAKAAQMAGAASGGAVRGKKGAAGGPAPRDAGEGPGDQAKQPKSPGPDTPGAEAWAQDMLTRVVDKLRAWGQPVTPLGFEIGPTFVRLKVTPQGLTEVNKVRNRAESLQTHLGFPRPVITAQAGYISVDVQRPDRQTISLRDLLLRFSPILTSSP